MRTAASDSTEKSRITTGVVNTDGTILKGLGFTVTKTGTGAYNIKPRGYRALQSGMASLYGTYGFGSVTVNPTDVQVATFTSAGSPVDVGFSFYITGIAQ